jgi:hypothetical protein
MFTSGYLVLAWAGDELNVAAVWGVRSSVQPFRRLPASGVGGNKKAALR